MNKLQSAEQLRRVLQMFAQTLGTEAAMEVATVYEPWQAGKTYAADVYLTHGVNSVGDPQLYRTNQEHPSSALYPPGSLGSESLYTAIGLDAEGYPIWSAPTGAHDAYNIGDIVDYDGTLYQSQIDGNTTVPGTDERWWSMYEA